MSFFHWSNSSKIYFEQECIPVGCIPSAAVAVSPGGVGGGSASVRTVKKTTTKNNYPQQPWTDGRTHIKTYRQQECIPLGCVPPACCPYLPACTAPGGCTCLRGCTCPGGVYLPGAVYLPRGVYLPRYSPL